MRNFVVLKKRLGVVESRTHIDAPDALAAINAAMTRAGFDPATPLAGVSWTAVEVK